VARIAADESWISANDALCSLLGYKRDDLTQKPFDTVFQTSAEQAKASGRKRLTSGEISGYTSSRTAVCKDGISLPVAIRFSVGTISS
jgi:PAS domain S-box-containing protein